MVEKDSLADTFITELPYSIAKRCSQSLKDDGWNISLDNLCELNVEAYSSRMHFSGTRDFSEKELIMWWVHRYSKRFDDGVLCFFGFDFQILKQGKNPNNQKPFAYDCLASFGSIYTLD